MAPKLNFSLSLQHSRATLLPQLQLVFPLIVNIFPVADADQIFSKYFQFFFSAADADQRDWRQSWVWVAGDLTLTIYILTHNQFIQSAFLFDAIKLFRTSVLFKQFSCNLGWENPFPNQFWKWKFCRWQFLRRFTPQLMQQNRDSVPGKNHFFQKSFSDILRVVQSRKLRFLGLK